MPICNPPFRERHGGKPWRRVSVGVLLAAFVILALSSAVKKSATWDETHYLGLGVYLLETGRWDIPSVLLHPPMPHILNSIPLLFVDLDRSCFRRGESGDVISGVRRGQCLLKNSSPAGDRLLLLSRLPTILLGLLLGCYVYLWASRLFGPGGALLSLTLYCLSPNILAHTRLITPDLPLTAFGFIAVYYFWLTVKEGERSHLVLCGLFLGLTLLSKYSGLLWIPLMGVLALVYSLEGPLRPFRPSRISFASGPMIRTGGILFIACLVMAAGYGFHLGPYFSGMMVQGETIGKGLPAFLNGQVSRNGGWFHYYLFGFLFKVPVPMLLLMGGFPFLRKGHGAPDRFTATCLLFPVLSFLVVFSCLTKVNIGIRYILPVFPFLMVFAGSAVPSWKRLIPPWIVILLLIWYVYEGLSIHPHYLAYFNQLAGGPRQGYRRLVDSNLDWGQDLKGLKAYMDRRGIGRVKLSYFGTADPGQYDIRYEALPSFLFLNPPSRCRELKRGDVIAVSATMLNPVYVDLGGLRDYLLARPFDDHVGYAILIYTLHEDLLIAPEKEKKDAGREKRGTPARPIKREPPYLR